MDDNLFAELKESLVQAKDIRSGRLEARRTRIIDVKAIRERTKLSQAEFATAINVSVRTLQNWEQQRRVPTGPATALLKVVETAPDVALDALRHYLTHLFIFLNSYHDTSVVRTSSFGH